MKNLKTPNGGLFYMLVNMLYDKDIEGIYQWKIRDELYEALTEFNIMQYLHKLDASKYTKSDFLSEVYMEEIQYDDLCALPKHKKNVILEGAPVVDKPFAAKRLAYAPIRQYKSCHQTYAPTRTMRSQAAATIGSCVTMINASPSDCDK